MTVGLLSGGCTPAAILPASGCKICFASDDWVDSLLCHRLVKGNRAIHVAMIGHRAGLHAKRFDTLGQRLDLDSAVEKTVVSMKMEMCEVLVLHDRSALENSKRERNPKVTRSETISRGVGESTRQYL